MKNPITVTVATLGLVAMLLSGSALAQTKPAPAPSSGGAVARRIPAAKPVTGVVNINTASAADLTMLPKVGKAMAARIIEYRTKSGGFKKVEELLNVKGIGEKSLEMLRPHLAITGATTIKLAQL